MEKKLLVVLVVVGLCSTVAVALDPMGPPAAGLKQGQWSVGVEYAWSQMDIKAVNGRYEDYSPEAMSGFNITDLKENRIYGNIGYGISDKWEAFLRLGVAYDGIDGDLEGIIGDPYPGDFDTDSAFAIGCGTKMTLHESSPDLKWGALAQISWTQPDGKFKTDYPFEGDVKFKFTEVQFAVGPTCKVAQGISVYGGPFIHFVDGEMWTENTGSDDHGAKANYDLEQQTNFGGYIGAQVELGTNAAVNVEWMHTDNADAVGVQGVWKL